MKKRIISFGASSSRQSINKQLATYAASTLNDVDVEYLDLNDYEMPIFSIDKEIANGIHPLAHAFKSKVKECDGIVISLAEHNSSYSAAFKNILDWISRIDGNIWEQKPMWVLATSPGKTRCKISA